MYPSYPKGTLGPEGFILSILKGWALDQPGRGHYTRNGLLHTQGKSSSCGNGCPSRQEAPVLIS